MADWADLGISPKEIRLYFYIEQWSKKWYKFLGVFLISGAIGYFSAAELLWTSVVLFALCLLRLIVMHVKCPTDQQIDEAWHLAAQSRIEEAYRVSNFEPEDAIRDIDFFFCWPLEALEEPEYKSKIGKDNLYRSNYQQLVYIIYGEDQIMSFEEPYCLENQWDGVDETKEYYWKDIGGIEFNQRDEVFYINSQGLQKGFYLAGDKDVAGTSYMNEKANEIANSARTMLREKKRG